VECGTVYHPWTEISVTVQNGLTIVTLVRRSGVSCLELPAVHYSVSQKNRTATIINIHFTNSQHSLISCGTDRPYSILHWLRQKVFKLA